jgi:succinyl-CoA synthetase alpha subunit
MAILIDQKSLVLVQGITGKEGSRAAREMREYGTNVVGGVAPGKGGQETEDGFKVYETVRDACAAHAGIGATLIVVPGKFVGSAVDEAIEARIPLINILSENVPLIDVARMIARATEADVRIVGPSSVGIISPGKAKIGSIGSGGTAERVFSSGPVGVISKSGGMTSELSRILTGEGIGQSTAVGIGGDLLIGSDFVDIALLFERDLETRALVVFGEVGGTYEERLATAIADGRISKPVIALIAGVFAETLPSETALGHAGAIIEGGRGGASAKIAALRAAGALIAETPEDIPKLLRTVL